MRCAEIRGENFRPKNFHNHDRGSRHRRCEIKISAQAWGKHHGPEGGCRFCLQMGTTFYFNLERGRPARVLIVLWFGVPFETRGEPPALRCFMASAGGRSFAAYWDSPCWSR